MPETNVQTAPAETTVPTPAAPVETPAAPAPAAETPVAPATLPVEEKQNAVEPTTTKPEAENTAYKALEAKISEQEIALNKLQTEFAQVIAAKTAAEAAQVAAEAKTVKVGEELVVVSTMLGKYRDYVYTAVKHKLTPEVFKAAREVVSTKSETVDGLCPGDLLSVLRFIDASERVQSTLGAGAIEVTKEQKSAATPKKAEPTGPKLQEGYLDRLQKAAKKQNN